MKPLVIKSALELTVETEPYELPDGEQLLIRIEVWREAGSGKLSARALSHDLVELKPLSEAAGHTFHADLWIEDTHLTLLAASCEAETPAGLIEAVLQRINHHFGHGG
jgi:hypothetical protein